MHYFNSIKVQLEPDKREQSPRRQPFQFHKGTIRTVDGTLQYNSDDSFQFHKGTIRTIWLIVRILWVCNFNSIKVQLELLILRLTLTLLTFQFHKGTIRTSATSTAASATAISIP